MREVVASYNRVVGGIAKSGCDGAKTQVVATEQKKPQLVADEIARIIRQLNS